MDIVLNVHHSAWASVELPPVVPITNQILTIMSFRTNAWCRLLNTGYCLLLVRKMDAGIRTVETGSANHRSSMASLGRSRVNSNTSCTLERLYVSVFFFFTSQQLERVHVQTVNLGWYSDNACSVCHAFHVSSTPSTSRGIVTHAYIS